MQIYLTLDYELFMGRKVGTTNSCLIYPTEKLIRLLDSYGVKATFFVDAAFLYRLSIESVNFCSLKNDLIHIERQLLELKNKGHDIQLHIHPQWFSAQYDGDEWHLKNDVYKLSDLDEDLSCDLFVKSKLYLEQLLGGKVCAYRAGGYSIQSFTKIKELFEKASILIDSSVLSMKKSTDGPQFYDYSSIKAGRTFAFDTDVAKSSSCGKFTELPITTGRLGILSSLSGTIKYHMVKKMDKRKFGDGLPIEGGSGKNRSSIIKLLNMNNLLQVATIDSGGSQNLLKIFKKQLKEDVFVVIGHPKNLSLSSLSDLEEFLKFATHKYCFQVVSSLKKV